MSRPAIQSFKLSDNLTLSECHPDAECRQVNWWLYDDRAGMNLAMRARTREDALVAALEYWAERYEVLHEQYDELETIVNEFVDTVRPSEEEDYDPPY